MECSSNFLEKCSISEHLHDISIQKKSKSELKLFYLLDEYSVIVIPSNRSLNNL